MSEVSEGISEEEISQAGNLSYHIESEKVSSSNRGLLFSVRIDFHRRDITLGEMVEVVQSIEHEMLKSLMEHMEESHEE